MIYSPSTVGGFEYRQTQMPQLTDESCVDVALQYKPRQVSFHKSLYYKHLQTMKHNIFVYHIMIWWEI